MQHKKQHNKKSVMTSAFAFVQEKNKIKIHG